MKADKVLNDESKFKEWKIQLKMLNNYISSKTFEETQYIYSPYKSIEIFMGSDTEDIIDELFDTILKKKQKQQKQQTQQK